MSIPQPGQGGQFNPVSKQYILMGALRQHHHILHYSMGWEYQVGSRLVSRPPFTYHGYA